MIKLILGLIAAAFSLFIYVNFYKTSSTLPLVAIANYGPHASLTNSIKGIKKALRKQGFIEGKTVNYAISDVSFDASRIPQMVQSLKQQHPKVMIVMTTPVAQYAKGAIHDIPLVFDVITDPVAAGLIQTKNQAQGNMTGASDQQDLQALIHFAKTLLPKAQRIGLLYSTAETNDQALVTMMREAAAHTNMSVVAIPINQAHDIPTRMHAFKDQVDFIYVGASGPIQPALPSIAHTAKAMHIPIFNVEQTAVKEGLAQASFGVNYERVGVHAGELTAALLQGARIADLVPIYPQASDYQTDYNKEELS